MANTLNPQRKQYFTCTLRPYLIDYIKQIAKELNLPINQVIEDAIKLLAQHQKEAKK